MSAAASILPVEPQVLTYPISPNYYRWPTVAGLREVLANALDEDPHPHVEWKDGLLTVEDKGPGIPEEGLILGISNKSRCQIGQFGEGIQAAGIVLARARNVGRVIIETVGFTLEPKLTKAPLLRAVNGAGTREHHELLSYEITPNTRKRGTKVTVECSEDLTQKAIAQFRHLADPNYQPPKEPGAILPNESGKIYVLGLFVQEKKGLVCSYDLTDKAIQNRDRTTIDGYELDRLIQQILLAVTDPDVLEPLVRAALEGKLTKAERAFNTYGADPGYRKAMRAVGKRIFGNEQVCYRNQGYYGHDGNHEDEAVLDLADRGYRVIEAKIDAWEHAALMKLLGVKSAGELYRKPSARKHYKQKTDWVELDKLALTQRGNFERAVATVKSLYGADAVGDIGVYLRTSLEEADTELHWGGFYQPTNGKIGLHESNLASFEETLEVLIHEAGHRIRHRRNFYDYGDRSRGFEDELVKMAATAAAKLSAAGLLPGSLAEYEEAEARKPRHPNATAADLIRARMQATGLDTYAKLADETGVTPHVARTIVKGEARGHRMSPKPRNVKAVCEALGLDWVAVWLAVSGANIMALYSRRKNGWLYGQGYVEAMEVVAELRERGAPQADPIEAHAKGTVPTKSDDDSWLAPYRDLIEAETARVAAL